jgi:serine/threonine-protein kinase
MAVVGQKVGAIVDRRYRVERIIAYGGVATVHEAQHLVTGRRLALKVPLPKYEQDKEIHRRLEREARALGLVRHPHVVDVLDAGTTSDGIPYLALELLEGKTLQGVLAARGRLSPATTLRIGLSLCDALAAAHLRGVIHRDVKPSNVFFSLHGGGIEMLKLIDFGAVLVESEESLPPDSEPLSDVGRVGTLEYTAPELLGGATTVGPQVDVYSVGVTLFECLTGMVPFEGNVARVIHQLTTRSAPPVGSVRTDTPPALAALVDRALARERADRFATIGELRIALGDALPDAPSTLPPLSLEAGFSLPPTLRAGRPSLKPADPLVGDAESVIQRRRFARVPYIMPVTIRRADGSLVRGRSEDLSEGGLRVLLAYRVGHAERVTVRFALPRGGEIVEIAATTRWLRAAREIGALGLEFADLSDKARDRIRTFVQAHADRAAEA